MNHSAIKIRRVFKVAMGMILAVASSGCWPQDQQQQQRAEEFTKWVQKMEPLRQKAEDQVSKVPYQRDQYVAFQAYLAELANKALGLKQDSNQANGLSHVLAKIDLNPICSQVFLAKAQWELMLRNCVRNGFFLCSEEVRYYPDMVRAFRESLLPEQQARFDATASCAQMLSHPKP